MLLILTTSLIRFSWRLGECGRMTFLNPRVKRVERLEKCTFYLAFAEGRPSLKMQMFIFWGVEMMIGWICSRDLCETSWEGLHEVLLIVIAEESRMFTCAFVASVVFFFSRNFEPLVSHMNVRAGCGRSWRAYLERCLVEMILTTMHTLRPSILA